MPTPEPACIGDPYECPFKAVLSAAARWFTYW